MMNDFTNNSFEEQWQNAFDDTSLTPSDALWDKIEQSLDVEAGPSSLPQTPKNTFPFYYLGSALVALLGIGYWVFIANTSISNEIQPILQEEIKLEKQILLKRVTPSSNEKIQKDIQPLSPEVPVKTKALPIVQSEEQPSVVVEDESLERIKLSDSIETLTPLSTKSVTHEWQQPVIISPADATPYYEPTKPKPQKKSIFKNVKVSVGVGTYRP